MQYAGTVDATELATYVGNLGYKLWGIHSTGAGRTVQVSADGRRTGLYQISFFERGQLVKTYAGMAVKNVQHVLSNLTSWEYL